MRRAPHEGLQAAALATERHELVVATIGAAQAQEAVRQDAALQESVELVFDKLRQAGAKGLFGLGEKALGVLLHQAVQRGLLGSVARVVHRGTIAIRPAGLARVGSHVMGTERLGRCRFSRRALQRFLHWGDIHASATAPAPEPYGSTRKAEKTYPPPRDQRLSRKTRAAVGKPPGSANAVSAVSITDNPQHRPVQFPNG